MQNDKRLKKIIFSSPHVDVLRFGRRPVHQIRSMGVLASVPDPLCSRLRACRRRAEYRSVTSLQRIFCTVYCDHHPQLNYVQYLIYTISWSPFGCPRSTSVITAPHNVSCSASFWLQYPIFYLLDLSSLWNK